MSLLVLLIVSTGIACVCAADSHNATVDNDSIQITDANPISFNASNDQQDVDSNIHDARVIDNTDSYAPHGRVDSLSQDNVSQASNQKEDRLD